MTLIIYREVNVPWHNVQTEKSFYLTPQWMFCSTESHLYYILLSEMFTCTQVMYATGNVHSLSESYFCNFCPSLVWCLSCIPPPPHTSLSLLPAAQHHAHPDYTPHLSVSAFSFISVHTEDHVSCLRTFNTHRTVLVHYILQHLKMIFRVEESQKRNQKKLYKKST